MKIPLLATILTAFFLTAQQGDASQGNVSLLTPVDGAFVKSRSINVVIALEPPASQEVRLSVNDGKSRYLKLPPGQEVFHFPAVDLVRGENRITVEYSNGEKIAEKTFRVFRKKDLFPNSRTAPREFKEFRFHTEKMEKNCQMCHVRELSDAFRAVGDNGKASCSRCHGKILAGDFVHGPAAVWSCRMCHDGSSREGKFSSPAPTGKICVPCHDSPEQWQKEPFLHGPTAMGECTACHDPHASKNAFFLRMNPTELCSACHAETTARPHVISVFSGGGHPVWISPNPLDPQKDFTCTSCHNPHAAQHSMLLNYDNSSMKIFCTSCHDM